MTDKEKPIGAAADETPEAETQPEKPGEVKPEGASKTTTPSRSPQPSSEKKTKTPPVSIAPPPPPPPPNKDVPIGDAAAAAAAPPEPETPPLSLPKSKHGQTLSAVGKVLTIGGAVVWFIGSLLG